MMAGKKLPQSIDSRILATIYGRGRGSVFVPADFLKIGSREAVDVALHRLVKEGTIRRLARGVYDFPKEHPVLGPLSPSAEAIAMALAGRDHTRLQPAGAYAANALGLSEQVPAKAVFLTDGPARTVKIGAMTIQLRRTTARNMAGPPLSSPATKNPDGDGIRCSGRCFRQSRIICKTPCERFVCW